MTTTAATTRTAFSPSLPFQLHLQSAITTMAPRRRAAADVCATCAGESHAATFAAARVRLLLGCAAKAGGY
ncbi:hypothetical protein V6Z12_D11G336800 [Gossypium hirsutum]